MKTRPFLSALAFLLATAGVPAAPRDTLWKNVETARQGKLPQSAIAALDSIIAGSLADKAYPEAIKALGQKIALETQIAGSKPEEAVTRLTAELAKAPPAMKPALEALLARWYWQYFQQNRWTFLQRTRTNAPPGPDFQTWDLPQILGEIDRHFTAALADEKILKNTPIRAYDLLLESGTAPDAYRPTLYDFLAYEALAFYQTGEQGAIATEDAFEIAADSPAFADADDFARWQPPSVDPAAPALKAIRLYQQLMEFHRSDKDRSAYYDADLSRLRYAHNIAVGDDKDARYQAALERFIAATTRHEISARALAELAGLLNRLGDPARAHTLATRGSKAFPESAGGAMCYNLIQQIEAKSAELRTEFVWNAPWPTLDLTYRNVTRVYFRAVPVDFEKEMIQGDRDPRRIDHDFVKGLLRRTPARAWDRPLPATTDFKLRTESLPAPTDLKPGYYCIIASHDPSFSDKDNQISAAAVWVSDLALVTQQQMAEGIGGGFVLNAITGEPVVGATVNILQSESRSSDSSVAVTDGNGWFNCNAGNGTLHFLARYKDQAVSSWMPVWTYRREQNQIMRQTAFFTDRALYRPGQTISYKGICLRSDPDRGSYEVIPRLTVTVGLTDANGKEVARATHTTNDYGSFSGTFTAPRDRTLGSMSLNAEEDCPGQTNIRVEEYKRPKFQVEIAPPAEAPKLVTATRVTVKATAYTGASIGGAKVKWRVERGVSLPPWCWWWQPPASKAIAHGTAVTAADGTTEIQFTAEPDRSVPEKNEPVFTYTIHADVTDTTGETRSADLAAKAGYTALQGTLAVAKWQTPDRPVVFTIETRSLDGTPQSATGTLTVHTVRQPPTVTRAPLNAYPSYRFRPSSTAAEPSVDPSNPDTWEPDRELSQQSFTTGSDGAAKLTATLPAGIYRASLTTKDRFGKTVTARQTVLVLDPQASRFGVKIPDNVEAPVWSVEPGGEFKALWGTGYDSGRAFVELESAGKKLKSYWTAPGRTQELITLPVTESLRGGLTLRITYIRENRSYFTQRVVDVPWSNKELTVKWESFRSKLLPGQPETWTAVITGPDAQRVSAEMVAALYDASLDQFAPHQWRNRLDVFRQEQPSTFTALHNSSLSFMHVDGNWSPLERVIDWRYRQFTNGLGEGDYARDEGVTVLSAFRVSEDKDYGYLRTSAVTAGAMAPTDVAVLQMAKLEEPTSIEPPPARLTPDLNQITSRRNLTETAFFFPHLLTDENGVVRMQFTMPEALTEWKFLGFAHDAQLRSGFLTAKAVTAKDLMVEPNPPRFVREGDVIEFTVKVSNRTDRSQTGRVRLTFADAATLQSADAALANTTPEQAFDVPAKQSHSYSWRLAVPDGAGFLTYKAVGATAAASDGEEGFLPVLSRRILVTESLPLPVRGATTKDFEFAKLLASGSSDTLRHQSLTVQMVSQPAWYAVMALPYLMEFPHECSEQLFNRLYANTLARHVANSDPKIRRIFGQWRNTPALDSPLEKNQDLKSVMIEETPWLREAAAESQSRRNVGLLFDANRLDEESARLLRQLAERQLPNGLWSWFPGGPSSEYISLYLVTGFGRLRHLGAGVDTAPALRALAALDAWMAQRHRDILKAPHPEKHVPSSLDALYLYGRSFFLADKPIAPENRAAVDFFLGQARQLWTKVDSRQSEAHLALALQRFGNRATPQAIVRSLKERSVTTEEFGMFWRDDGQSWWWNHAPIETQAMMIEAFDEVAGDPASVEACKVWLLKQKQTQNWPTTKATADATYALLLRGANLLASDALVEVSLGGEPIKPEKVEAGTGFYEQKFVRSEIKPAMGRVTVRKTDAGVSWGAVHWQYLEDMAKITPHEGTPLTLKKALFVKVNTARGPELRPVTGPVSVGDELVVRIELRTDRDLEYVHLKDQRGSGTEPVSVLSQYQYQDGLSYYESTRDAASHFFIERLPRGTYVFEYSTRVQLRGRYQTGIAEIQCMYAPEFNSHSESLPIEVK
jgi:uncharacterized protein YfaS (alpha-2-macroglobulin family)